MIDFTECAIDKLSNYGGSDQKRGIIYNGKRYMLKLSDRISTDKRDSLRDSYSNSIYSEYVCCHIIEMCGYDVQKTLLGQVVMDTKRNKDKVVPVVACENFIPEGYELIEFKNIQNTLSDEKPGRIPKINELYQIMAEENVYFTKEKGKRALERYWDTFIFDAFLGNFDRHGNNWGYLISKTNDDIRLAPIYDCGSCLYPQLSDEVIPNILNNEAEIYARIDTFPQAALVLENGKKANYREYISNLSNMDCTAALLRVYPKINMNKIHEFIDEMEEITDIRKSFYKTMLSKRYDLILSPAYEKALETEKVEHDQPCCLHSKRGR